MFEEEYYKMRHVERHYWWHAARRSLVQRLAYRYLTPETFEGAYLDVGCGTGAGLDEIGPRFTSAIGVDISPTALKLTREHVSRPLVCADAMHLPFASNTFSFFTCLDVIEHVRNDLDAISEGFRVCKPGGYAVYSVPTMDFLWSEHDEALNHFRRYSRRAFLSRLRHQGFEVVYSTYAVFTLFFGIFAVRVIDAFRRDSIHPKTMLPEISPLANGFLRGLLHLEATVSLRVPLPVGTGAVCLVRKPL